MFRRLYMLQTIQKRLFQQRVEPSKGRISPKEVVWKTIENTKINTPQDWKKIRDELLNNNGAITFSNIDAVTVGACTLNGKYDLALSYLDFLKNEKIQLNLATMGKYFNLLHVKGVAEGLSKEDEERIMSLYEGIRAQYPVLDTTSLDNVIRAISLTSKWKICLDLLEEMKITSSPTSYAYNAVISAAFLHNEDDLGWKLMDDLIRDDRNLIPLVYTSYFNRVTQNCKGKQDKVREIDKMFNFMQNNFIKIPSTQVDEFAEALKSVQLDVRKSIVTHREICKLCNTKLQKFEITQSEFDELKKKVIENVIIGKNVFNRTTPQELTKFKNFISKMESHDVVIDGLNVAYTVGVQQSPHVLSSLVAKVVAHFIKQNKKVLLFGRHHMKRWPRQNWGYVEENATVFLTENLSHDDPYLLYCALNAGKDTIIVTRDLMRGHKFLLKDSKLRNLFDRWLAQRQYQLTWVDDNGECSFKKPLGFSVVAQKSRGYWHIPYTQPNTGNSKVPTNKTYFLCVKL